MDPLLLAFHHPQTNPAKPPPACLGLANNSTSLSLICNQTFEALIGSRFLDQGIHVDVFRFLRPARVASHP